MYLWGKMSISENTLTAEFHRLVSSADEEVFEDGMETAFSNGLIAFVKRYGDLAIDVLAGHIIGETINAEVAAEVLRWIGQMDDVKTHHKRRWLLERCLNCSSARVRDGAVLGLSFLDDPHAIPYLESAIEHESIHELRRDMEQVLDQLRETKAEKAL
jgi:hypothetical protein